MINIYGNGLDSLVAINLFLESGHSVTHFSSSNNFGGHFQGIQTCGGYFDLGMVILEPDFSNREAKDLLEYDGEFGRESRPFLHQVFKWLETEMVKLVDHPVNTRLLTRELIADYYIGDNLEFLYHLNSEQKVQLVNRLRLVLSDNSTQNQLHPSRRFNSESSGSTPLQEVLCQVFGSEIYKIYFQGFLNKISGSSQPGISARDNRRVWMPNYYPESLLFALTKEDQYRKFELLPLRFLRPEKIQIADFIHKLINKIKEHSNYVKVTSKSINIEEDGLNKNNIYFLNAREFKQFSKFKSDLTCKDEGRVVSSSQIRITHLCIDEVSPQTIFDSDGTSPIIRYSFYASPIKHSVSIESTLSNVYGIDIAKKILNDHGIKARCLGKTIEVPLNIKETGFTPSDWYEYLKQIKVEFPNLNKNLFLIHPEASNFNDNLIRGLTAFRKWNCYDCK